MGQQCGAEAGERAGKEAGEKSGEQVAVEAAVKAASEAATAAAVAIIGEAGSKGGYSNDICTGKVHGTGAQNKGACTNNVSTQGEVA